ncbi:MAG: thioredoxin family protein [Ktedonobacteraceae bacterium]
MADSTASFSTISNQDFAEKVLQAPQMVIVNFSSARSSSCQIFEQEFAAISQEYQDRVTFAQVDVDSNEELIQRYNIDGIPTLIFFKDGQEIHRIKGIVMRDKLRRQVRGVLLVSNHANGDKTE